MEISPQNSTISSVIRLKERFIIFVGISLPSIVYLSCRSSEHIAHLYIAASYIRSILINFAVYCSCKNTSCHQLVNELPFINTHLSSLQYFFSLS